MRAQARESSVRAELGKVAEPLPSYARIAEDDDDAHVRMFSLSLSLSFKNTFFHRSNFGICLPFYETEKIKISRYEYNSMMHPGAASSGLSGANQSTVSIRVLYLIYRLFGQERSTWKVAARRRAEAEKVEGALESISGFEIRNL